MNNREGEGGRPSPFILVYGFRRRHPIDILFESGNAFEGQENYGKTEELNKELDRLRETHLGIREDVTRAMQQRANERRLPRELKVTTEEADSADASKKVTKLGDQVLYYHPASVAKAGKAKMLALNNEMAEMLVDPDYIHPLLWEVFQAIIKKS